MKSITIKNKLLIKDSEKAYVFTNRSGVERIITLPKSQVLETKESKIGNDVSTTYYLSSWFYKVARDSFSLFSSRDIVLYNAELLK